jgi:hypothetical protein
MSKEQPLVATAPFIWPTDRLLWAFPMVVVS